MDSELQQKIKVSSVNGKLPCAAAFKIARDLKIEPRSVREAADDLKIKISACQLGCFP
ncbi:MAG: hypothetical protein PHV74_13370 [Dehalococcoidia bacterium]|nr:hypothetical protein [Dehalococcoidia bacterium]